MGSDGHAVLVGGVVVVGVPVVVHIHDVRRVAAVRGRGPPVATTALTAIIPLFLFLLFVVYDFIVIPAMCCKIDLSVQETDYVFHGVRCCRCYDVLRPVELPV